MVINELDMEDYLKGVLPFEIGHHNREKLEALKAQAVAARTYTFKRLLSLPAERSFDLYNDVRDQVYKGQTGEYLLADRAIRETKGIVAVYGDSLTECYYSSTCGGVTSNISEVWPDKPDKPYLVSVSDKDANGHFCSGSKYFTWQQEWSNEQLNTIIKTYLPQVDTTIKSCGKFKKLQVLKRGRCNRVTELLIVTESGSYKIGGDKIRWVLRRPEAGNPILFSAWFTLTQKRESGGKIIYRASGNGWGHGVGLCQVGALKMAERGYTYEQILKHYYKGIKLIRWKY
jgi:stage II sporulation protein D